MQAAPLNFLLSQDSYEEGAFLCTEDLELGDQDKGDVVDAVIANLNLPVVKTSPMVVMVANGAKMVTDTKCEALQFSLQGEEFTKGVRFLEVQGCDMILGIDWLVSLGPMMVDWGRRKLEFQKGDKAVTLQVKEEVAEIKWCEEALDVDKEQKRGSELMLAHLFQVSEGVGTVHPKVLSLLEEYSDLFAEPNALPPKRSIDHKNPLLPGAQPVNFRPYRYYFFQKLEIEKIVQEGEKLLLFSCFWVALPIFNYYLEGVKGYQKQLFDNY